MKFALRSSLLTLAAWAALPMLVLFAQVNEGETGGPEASVQHVMLPNVFTPNGDGVNDVFRPMLSQMSDFRLRIFNRNGQEVYEGNGGDVAWDGRHAGGQVPEGVYFFFYRGTTTDGRELKQTGSLTVLR
jgi:gliding motility-associated-like protein